MTGLLIRNVEVEGRPGQDVAICDGRIVAIGPKLRAAGEMLDGAGGALIPGLIDHHLHLLGAAAAASSIDLSSCADASSAAARIAAVAEAQPGGWMRATGCPASFAMTLDTAVLDRWAPAHALRVQDRTGALWVLNSCALALVGDGPGLERDAAGRVTGRVWRGDRWLGERIGRTVPSLRQLGAQLAELGITGVTDTSATTDASAAVLLGDAHASGALPQHLTLMSGGALAASAAYRVGAVKIILDERELPSLDELAARIALARQWGRAVAFHCVTAVELALLLAAMELAGAWHGDRIEHGALIPAAAITPIATLGLTVVTQPGFIAARGEAYRRDVEIAEQSDLYRCATLLANGVAVAGSSDAPYGPLDCWAAMRTAVTRQTAGGAMLGTGERLSPKAALGLYLGAQDDPGGPPRRVVPGASADLCLLRTKLPQALLELDAANVAATIIAGEIVWRKDAELTF